MESKSSSFGDENVNSGPPIMASQHFRPPPLRTSNTYDDDDAFYNVGRNLLSRHFALELSVSEAIRCTLIKPQERVSFYEGLQYRKLRMAHTPHRSPTTMTLIEDIDRTFGAELKKMIDAENVCLKRQELCPAWSGSMVQEPKKQKHSRFFPDSSSDPGSSSFFRSRARVQNLDWKLVEAISQVQSLRLDGSPAQPSGHYQPPSGTGL